MKKPSSKIREEIGRLQEQLKHADAADISRPPGVDQWRLSLASTPVLR